jgi:hypothetical protein
MDDDQNNKLKTELNNIFDHIDAIIEKIQAVDPDADHPSNPKNEDNPSDRMAD